MDVVVAISTLVLVIVTGAYVILTRSIAVAAGEQATAATEQAAASQRLAEQAERQHRTSLRPVLDLSIEKWGTDYDGDWPTWLILKAKNVGPGPALNIQGIAPFDEEAGFEGGLRSLGSLGPSQESGSYWLVIDDEYVWLDYSDIFDKPYRSKRRFIGEEGISGNSYSFSLGELEVIER